MGFVSVCQGNPPQHDRAEKNFRSATVWNKGVRFNTNPSWHICSLYFVLTVDLTETLWWNGWNFSSSPCNTHHSFSAHRQRIRQNCLSQNFRELHNIGEPKVHQEIYTKHSTLQISLHQKKQVLYNYTAICGTDPESSVLSCLFRFFS